MAIELERTAQLWGITGNLGGGKSLTAVWFAVRAIQSGYFVCSNITLKESALVRLVGEYAKNLYQHISLDDPDFDPFKLPCGSPRGHGGDKRVLVILDECAEWIDQYSSAKNPRIFRLWSWLRHSSKRSQDVFIIVQRPDYLNKVVRILISRWIIVADLATYRLPVLRCRFPFMSGYVMRNVYDRSGTRIGGVSFIRKSTWGVFYDTAECLNAQGSQYTAEYTRPRIRRRMPLFFAFLYVFSYLMLFNAVRRLRAVSGRAGEIGAVNGLSIGSRRVLNSFSRPEKIFVYENSRSSSNGVDGFSGRRKTVCNSPQPVGNLFATPFFVGGIPRALRVCAPRACARLRARTGLVHNTTLCTQETITCS